MPHTVVALLSNNANSRSRGGNSYYLFLVGVGQEGADLIQRLLDFLLGGVLTEERVEVLYGDLTHRAQVFVLQLDRVPDTWQITRSTNDM